MPHKNQTLDATKVKEDFPILQRKVHGRLICYLDNAATSQKPRQVVDAMVDFYNKCNANVHRAIYELGEEATRGYEEAREKIARFINAKSASEVVFTKGTTESLNMVAYGWGLKGKVRKGDKIVTTVMEHHSNMIPWFFVREMAGAAISWIDIDDDGHLRMDDLDRTIDEKTKVVAVTQCSNVLGTINPIKEIAKRAHEVNAVCVVDAAQSVPHMPVDVQSLGCDLLAFSGHKMLGPTGIGVLYGRMEVLEEMEPLLGGGEMIMEVHLDRARWNEVPYKFEGGTPNMAGAFGLGVAVDYLDAIGMSNVRKHEMELTSYAIDVLKGIEGVKVYGPRRVEERGGVVSFNVDGVHPHDVASIFDAEGIAIRSGHSCAQPLMERLGLAAAARASFYIYNTPEDVDRLGKAVKKVQEVFA